MTTIAVVSVGRSDYGLYRPLLRRLAADRDMTLQLIVAGAHFASVWGETAGEIAADRFTPAARLDCAPADDSPAAVVAASGRLVTSLAPVYERLRPDLLIALGDRVEMHAAATAAVPFLIPIAHIGGGAITLGAIDDALRHSLAKLACLHFVETEADARRVEALGEDPCCVHVTGALGLDNLNSFRPLDATELGARHRINIDPARPPLLVTFHPETRAPELAAQHIQALLAALDAAARPIVFTYPNADAGGRAIIAAIDRFVAAHAEAQAVPHLGTTSYFSLMAAAAAMVGNSSSGLIEAASFGLPVVDIGARQAGRLAPANVIHAEAESGAILSAIEQAASPRFRARARLVENPYGDGRAAERIHSVLKRTDLALLRRRPKPSPAPAPAARRAARQR